LKVGPGIVAALLAVVPASGDETPGSEWAIVAPLAPRSLLLDAAAAETRVVAVGERGHVVLTLDHGGSWEQARVPTRALLTGVFFHDDRTGWAVGHDETILRTDDGGRNWELQHSDPAAERPLLDVWFADELHGFAVGAYGAFLVTEDGGATWTDRPISDEDYHLNAIAAAPDGTLYLAGEAGHLYRSDDGGVTWRGLEAPYEGSFFGALPLHDGALLVFGLRGKLFRSEDRGTTWTALDTGTEATLMTGVERGDSRVVLAGLAGALLVSDDDGRSFRNEPLADRLAGVALVDDGRGLLLFGEGGSRRLGGDR